MASDEKNTPELTGLSSQEAERRLQEEGFNELPKEKQRTWRNIIVEVLREPMFMLLVFSSVIYTLLGDIPEAMMLLCMIALVIGITVYQENKTEHALEELKELSSPRAMVIRDGETRRIPGREVVREDLILLSEGDRVPADGVLIAGASLSVDESLLSGESVPVRKNLQNTKEAQLYSGTLVVQGQGTMRVLQTGVQTELGKIGHSLSTLEIEATSLQKETRRLVRIFAFWGGFLCIVVFLAYGLLRGSWLSGFLAGITLAMSVLPEESPMVLTVFMALGAWRLAQNKVLTRRMPAIEALGAATVLCTDKTGTLTVNRMTVVRASNRASQELDLSNLPQEALADPEFTDILWISALASQPEAIDPMDRGAREAAKRYLSPDTLEAFRQPARVYPITQELFAITLAWQQEDGRFLIATKGAPEAVISLCKLNEAESQTITQTLKSMAAKGLRVLGIAKASWEQKALPEQPGAFPFEFVGLLGYVDPIRPSVPEAIKDCHTAGIRIMMITGDYPETARSIAMQIGLKNPDKILTGNSFNALSDEALPQAIREVNVFARMVPEQKLRLVTALKTNGEIVAMTGDGVNDAPALKAAHIGIAMGKRGTDVAREAAHLVLLEDDFSSIVQAIRMGRRIFDNLRKAMAYIMAIHIPIAGMAILPVLFGLPLVLFPAHIAFLEMVIDPACSVAFEAEPSETNVMTRPPRALNEPLFSRQFFFHSILQGNIVLLAILGAYGYVFFQSRGEADTRTVGFITLLLCNLMLISSNLAGETSILKLPFLKNRAYWWVIGSATALLALIMTIPFLRQLFHFSQIPLVDYGICLIAVLGCLFILERGKGVMRSIYFK